MKDTTYYTNIPRWEEIIRNSTLVSEQMLFVIDTKAFKNIIFSKAKNGEGVCLHSLRRREEVNVSLT